MRTSLLQVLRVLLAVVLCALAVARSPAAPAFESQQRFSQWIAFYYLDPEPGRIPEAIEYMSSSGILDNPNAVAPMFGFLSGVFRDHPGEIAAWVGPAAAIADRHRAVLILAVWYAAVPESRRIVDRLLEKYPELESGTDFLYYASPGPVEQIDVERGAWVLDALWGKFMATGDSAPVERIVGILPWLDAEGDMERLRIGGAAAWSLTSNAIQHQRVLDICIRAGKTLDGAAAVKVREIVVNAEKELRARRDAPAHAEAPW